MGLFDLFKRKSKNTATQEDSDFAKIMREDYEETKKEVEKLQAENAAWEKDFNTILNFRTKASTFEKEGKLQKPLKSILSQLLLVTITSD